MQQVVHPLARLLGRHILRLRVVLGGLRDHGLEILVGIAQPADTLGGEPRRRGDVGDQGLTVGG